MFIQPIFVYSLIILFIVLRSRYNSMGKKDISVFPLLVPGNSIFLSLESFLIPSFLSCPHPIHYHIVLTLSSIIFRIQSCYTIVITQNQYICIYKIHLSNKGYSKKAIESNKNIYTLSFLLKYVITD